MISVNEYCRRVFKEKLYKISLDAGFTCPNRDGRVGRGGCIFCSEGGSGDFASDRHKSIEEQIEEAKERLKNKYSGKRYIAYFQAFTNTYAPVSVLEKLYMKVIEREDIAALSIATRPDCIDEENADLIRKLNKIKPVWIELGLQTVRQDTADYIRRGYELEVYDKAVEILKGTGIHIITHVILGLPGENIEDMAETVKYAVEKGSNGIKLQLLHVLKGTDLADDYKKGKFQVMTLDEYIEALKICLKNISEDTVIHRLTGDGPKKLLIAPLWSADKKRVLNRIKKEFSIFD